jgi:ABC-type lipoprotein release transport system permease subunit
MFFTYLRRELRRRMRQAIFIGLGLAVGIGLVITVTAASAGVKNAQATVLHSLYGVGTDITVTKAPTQGSGGPQGFGFGFAAGTDKRPAAGTKIDNETLRSFNYGTIASSSVTSVKDLKNVAAAAGGLTLTDNKITGTVPAINTANGAGGRGTAPGSGGGNGSGGFRNFRANFNSSNFSVTGVDLNSGELGPLSTGKLTSGATFISSDTNSDVAVVESSYATSNKLAVGGTITVDKVNFKIIGIVSEPAGASPSDVYIPLAVAQNLAGMKNQVNTIYVAADNASDIGGVATTISKAVPGSTITDQNSLASQVTGSLSSASSLANSLGKWLAIAVLIAAFLLASLLTMSAVSRRIREFGTLKALGWKSRRVIGQVMGESIAIGIIGGVVGVGLGFGGARLVDHFAGSLTATVGATTGSATPGGAQTFGGGGGGGGFGGGGGGFGGGAGGSGAGRFGFGRAAADVARTVPVHLVAQVTITTIVVAVVLAIAGGLIAGMFGGWRAARLRPAAALSKVA